MSLLCNSCNSIYGNNNIQRRNIQKDHVQCNMVTKMRKTVVSIVYDLYFQNFTFNLIF